MITAGSSSQGYLFDGSIFLSPIKMICVSHHSCQHFRRSFRNLVEVVLISVSGSVNRKSIFSTED